MAGFKLHINDRIYDADSLTGQIPTEASFELDFCHHWFNGKEDFEFTTSGSTGRPKKIVHSRATLELSARKTLEALPLQDCTNALLCMDPRFIGGRMMLVRAMIAGWELYVVPPSSNPFKAKIPTIDFVSMVPMQFLSSLAVNAGRKYLEDAKCILLGGSGIDDGITRAARSLMCPVFHSYGMTETASHIAIRRLNGSKEEDFSILPGIEIGLDTDGRICIRGDITGGRDIVTNDLGQMTSDTTFRILGRADNVIISGGIKISLDRVESEIREKLGKNGFSVRFTVVAIPDAVLGEKLVLATERSAVNWADLLPKMQLERYHEPKVILELDRMPLTPSHKPDRQKLIKLATEKL